MLKLDILPFLEFDMTDTLDVLVSAGFINRYTVDGKEYGEIPTFGDHQRIGGKEAQEPVRYPEPAPLPREAKGKRRRSNGEATVKQQGSTGEAPGKQSGLQEGKGIGREEEKEGEGNGFLSGALAPDQHEADPPEDAQPEEAPPFITLPTNKQGVEYPVTLSQLVEFSELYPGVNVEQALRNMRGWLLSNQPKRKTIRGMPSFITSWLSREQDRPRSPHTLNGNAHEHTGKRSYCPTPESDLERRRIAGIA
jgi:hypothetical protein